MQPLPFQTGRALPILWWACFRKSYRLEAQNEYVLLQCSCVSYRPKQMPRNLKRYMGISDGINSDLLVKEATLEK